MDRSWWNKDHFSLYNNTKRNQHQSKLLAICNSAVFNWVWLKIRVSHSMTIGDCYANSLSTMIKWVGASLVNWWHGIYSCKYSTRQFFWIYIYLASESLQILHMYAPLSVIIIFFDKISSKQSHSPTLVDKRSIKWQKMSPDDLHPTQAIWFKLAII